MCSFNEMDSGGVFDTLLQVFFLSAGCVVEVMGFWLAIFLIAFSPLYWFFYLHFRRKSSAETATFNWLLFVLCLMLSLLLIGAFWIGAAILNQWG